jgi:hypothetical protein
MRVLIPNLSVTVARRSSRASLLSKCIQIGEELGLRTLTPITVATTYGGEDGIILGMLQPADAAFVARSLAAEQELRLWFLGIQSRSEEDGDRQVAVMSLWAKTRTGSGREPTLQELLTLLKKPTPITSLPRKASRPAKDAT